MEEALNSLIDDFHEFIDQINGTNEFEIFSKFYNETTLALIEPWVRTKFNKTTIKCATKAQQFREDGNRHFRVGGNILAVLSYTKSVIYAPFDSFEFNLSLGNRSAALYHLGEYEGCIQDLELCLNTLNYPETKKFKLYQRLIQSYIDLNLGLRAKQTHGKLLTYLNGLGNFPNEFDAKQITKYTEIADNFNELIDIVIQEDKPPKLNKIIVPEFPGEGNTNFDNASLKISLKFDETKGRYVTAACDIKHGDVLFIEKTRCFVPITQEEDPNNYTNICYNCFVETCAAIPCDNCDELYCSPTCKNQSWAGYHRFECVGSASQVWKNIGVNFLAFRIFLHGFQNGFHQNGFNEKIRGNVDVFSGNCDGVTWYKRVTSLISNVQRMQNKDLLPPVVSALVIVTYLKEKTDFFAALRRQQNEYFGKSEVEIAREMGAVLLKHILQVICNASIIEGVKEEFFVKFNSDEEIKESGMFVQGTGLFPSVSLMNHSCDSNVTNYFLQDTIIVKANREIRKGEEILNCYGHDCRSESTMDRKTNLNFQYYFECCCSACQEPSRPEMYENGLLCPKCKSCALNQTLGEQTAKCLQCCYEFITEEHAKILMKSDKLYKKWQISKDAKYLEECYQLERNIYYKYNYKFYDLIQDLQTYYKNTGQFNMWWNYTEMILDLDKKIYGCCSLKYGLNLRETLICLVSRQFLPKTVKLDLLDRIEEMLQLSKEIFELYYPKHKLKYDFISGCVQKLRTNISGI